MTNGGLDNNATTPERVRRNFQRLVKFLSNFTFPSFATADLPPNPVEGQVAFDKTDKHFKGWNGTTWTQLDN